MAMNASTDKIRDHFERWYSALRRYHGIPAKGTLAGALVVLNRLKTKCELNIEAHTAKGKSQIVGASGAAVRKILVEFNETRPLLVEGGRTNRGLRGDIASLLAALKKAELCKELPQNRVRAIEQMQAFLVKQIQDIHARSRIEIDFDPSSTSQQFVKTVLSAAHELGKHGPVSEYLVGAKLQLRFPMHTIENKISSAADQPRGRSGDFQIGDTVFHVTVAPGPLVYEKCRTNISNGLRVYLLVPEVTAVGAKQNADQIAEGKIAVVSIEAFVSQNIDELGQFDSKLEKHEIARLLFLYNQRVDQVEHDKSLLIKIPAVLDNS